MLRVAVAEDNPKDRERLLGFLKQYGEEKKVQIEIAEYTDGSELLEQYRPCYDVIFLDVEMPHMDGIKAAEKIREMDEEIKMTSSSISRIFSAALIPSICGISTSRKITS